MEVIATGRISTFPGSSKYQIVVETLEPAGIGALMALLEERRRKLQAEGLFAAERKRRLPFLPRVIGVVTSPTGAVIRDILHRLEDRFPRQVLVWPVRVQGETSAAEVAAAIRGFNALAPGGPIPRPDVLIVARGGGSHRRPVGLQRGDRGARRGRERHPARLGGRPRNRHDARSTTPPTCAPRRRRAPPKWWCRCGSSSWRRSTTSRAAMSRHALRLVERRRSDLRATARALPSPEALISPKRQRLDLAATRLYPALAAQRPRP